MTTIKTIHTQQTLDVKLYMIRMYTEPHTSKRKYCKKPSITIPHLATRYLILKKCTNNIRISYYHFSDNVIFNSILTDTVTLRSATDIPGVMF